MQIFLIKGQGGGIYKVKAKKLFLISLLLIVVSLLNPNGWKGLLQPLAVISDKFLINNIKVYLSPDFHDSNIYPFKTLLLLVIAVFALSMRRQNIIEVVLVALFTSMALYSVRNIPLYAIIIAPVLLRDSKQISSVRSREFDCSSDLNNQKTSKINMFSRDSLWLILPVVIVWVMAVSGHIHHQFDERIKPVIAVEFLKIEPIQGNMYNYYEFGGYIIYSAYPQYRVFIDGRAEMYGAERFREYCLVRDIRPGWEKILEKYGVNFVIFSSDSNLSRFLLENNSWRIIYSDKVASIFVRNTSENKRLIKKYQNVRQVILQ
ncbi:MAG: hypothetical protein JW925_11695 [Syntrophaceae bacterium]|nr:hypothetical protein [Syntrophaceae bacterium]